MPVDSRSCQQCLSLQSLLASAEFSLWPENRTQEEQDLPPVGEGQTASSDKKMGIFFNFCTVLGTGPY